jgi:hypothetical protein
MMKEILNELDILDTHKRVSYLSVNTCFLLIERSVFIA